MLWAVLVAAAANWERSLQQAVQLHQSGDLRSACAFYRAAIEEHAPLQAHWAVLTNFALAQQVDSPEEAAATFERVLELQPTSADAYFNLGTALSECKQAAEAWPAAVKAFEHAIAINPTDGGAYYNMGTTQLQMGGENVVAALRSLQTSVALQPTDAKSYHSLGDAYAASREWERSVAAYRTATALRPEHAAGWASLGNALEEMNQGSAAEESWRKSLALHADAGVYNNLGGYLRRADRMAESRHVYQQAVELDPRNAEAYIGLGKCFQAPAGALAADNKAENDKSYLAHLRRTYGVAIALQPNNAGAYNAIGEGMTMFGLRGGSELFEGKGAHEMYETALALAPGNTCAATHVAYGTRWAEQQTCDGSVALQEDEDGSAVDQLPAGDVSLRDLTVNVEAEDALEQAIRIWRRHGVVLFQNVLTPSTVDALLQSVRDAQFGNHTQDYTAVTRDKTYRTHKALPVSSAADALQSIAQKLQPFLTRALGAKKLPVLESGFMVTAPGASAQQFHRDVAPAVVSCSSQTASLQISLVDTAANQGPLEIIPSSHTFDASVSDRSVVESSNSNKLPVAVPAGTVAMYALHLIHRGSANTHTEDRPFFFFTIMGSGLAPPGLAYTIEPDDIGRWQMCGGQLERTG
ncbi:hypothetical protein AB1Y20_000131 [Prymnesium parvum]|uniref:Protein O-GlcNAc transferase n=1 Tax=Prymnesium parvum TaxID=97485 RepID=A0AB34K7L7_PRYPA